MGKRVEGREWCDGGQECIKRPLLIPSHPSLMPPHPPSLPPRQRRSPSPLLILSQPPHPAPLPSSLPPFPLPPLSALLPTPPHYSPLSPPPVKYRPTLTTGRPSSPQVHIPEAVIIIVILVAGLVVTMFGMALHHATIQPSIFMKG